MRRLALALLLAVPLIADTPVSPPRVGPAAADQRHMRLALAGDRILAVWGDNRATRRFDDFAIWATVMDLDGNFLTPMGILVDDATGPATHDVVALHDRFIIVWLTADAVYGRAYDFDAKPLGPARKLMPVHDRYTGYLRADVAVLHGRLLVATGPGQRSLVIADQNLRITDEVGRNVQLPALTTDGNAFLAVDRDVFSDTILRIDTAGIATQLATYRDRRRANVSGRAVWTGREIAYVISDRDLKSEFTRFDRNGTLLSRETLTEAWVIDSDVDVASPGDGSALAVWSEYPYDIYVAPLGGTKRAFELSRATDSNPAILWTGTRYVIAWSANGDIRVAFADREGNRIAEGTSKLLSYTEQRFGSGVRGTPSDWITWQESDGEKSQAWIGNALRSGGTTIARAVAESNFPQTLPRIASSGDQLLAVWRESNQIRARRLTMDGIPTDSAPLTLAYCTECLDITTIWDGYRYLIAWNDEREVWLTRLDRYGPERWPVLAATAHRTRFPLSLNFATSRDGAVLVFNERPYPCDCTPEMPVVNAIVIDRNAAIADRFVAVGTNNREHPNAPDIAFDGDRYILVWHSIPFDGVEERIYVRPLDGVTPVTVARTTKLFVRPTIVATSDGVQVATIDFPGPLLTFSLDRRLRTIASTSIEGMPSNTRLVAPNVYLFDRPDPELHVIRLFTR